MKPYNRNPRQITKQRFNRLDDTLTRLGDLGGIVHNLRNDMLVGGHQRKNVFGDDVEIEIVEKYDKPDKQGTVAHGFIIWKGNKYSYRQVDWDDKTMAEANIVANLEAGQWDWDLLSSWKPEELHEYGFDGDLLGNLKLDIASLGNFLESEETEDDNYSRKIEPPIYEPLNEKPSLTDLFDDTKTQELLRDIENLEGISEQERNFLRLAAQRHTVFRFDRIADYYAHSEQPVQNLMENSALVIIDFEKAIENGFVKLSKEIAQLAYEDAN